MECKGDAQNDLLPSSGSSGNGAGGIDVKKKKRQERTEESVRSHRMVFAEKDDKILYTADQAKEDDPKESYIAATKGKPATFALLRDIERAV